MGEAFDPWNFDLPLDVHVVDRIPPTTRLRPIFPRAILDAARRIHRPLPVGRFFEQGDATMRDVAALLPVAAHALHPDVPVREAMRRLGRLSHDALMQSRVGALLFLNPKHSLRHYLAALPRGVAASGNHAAATIVLERDHAVLSLERYRSYVEGAIGAIEAGVESFGARADIRVRVRAWDAYDLLIRWT